MNQQDRSRATTPDVAHRRFTDRVAPIGEADWLDTYRAMALARRVDAAEADLTSRGLAFFSCPCTGHEAMAVLARLLTDDDWLHLHYRDKALWIARGLSPSALLHNVVAGADSPSAGRQMTPFVGDPALKILCQNVPVGNHAPQAVGVAAAVVDRPGRPVVLCSMGDGASQEGEVLEAIAEAVRRSLPVLFLVEDNGLSISTRTAGKTFYSLPDGYDPPTHHQGLPIHRLDGRDPIGLFEGLAPVVSRMRGDRRPAIVVVSVDRLTSHTNADDDRVYRSAEEVDRARRLGDPLANLRRRLIEGGIPAGTLGRIDEEADSSVRVAVEAALASPDPDPVPDAKAPLPPPLLDPEREYRGTPGGDRLTMLEAIRAVLRHRLASDPRVTLCGQDIEDPKGDVFGVTRGLSTAFPGRVLNAALAESTIVGGAIGRAMVGERPVAFLQFADFLPVAFNQIHSELGSLWWRSAGTFSCPVILMVACGGYRPGLGPFHAQTMESLAAHVPGVDVFMPSTAPDAAGLLNAAFESGRPTILFYPKIALNDRDRTTSADVIGQLALPGRARYARRGDDLTLVCWGATVALAEKVADAIADQVGLGVEVIDLRSLSPWDRDAVRDSARRTGRLLVVHEDNLTVGFGAEVVADVAESVGPAVRCRRVARPDTYIPCNFSAQLEILPSFRRTLEAAAGLLGLELSWDLGGVGVGSRATTIEARGTSPADESVTVLSWKVRPGDSVRSGEPIAELVADKAVFDFVSPIDGQVSRLSAAEGEAVRVGSPLLEIEASSTPSGLPRRRPTREEHGRPVLRRRAPSAIVTGTSTVDATIRLGVPSVCLGSAVVRNADLLARLPGWTEADILKRTGIASRRRLGPGESAQSLAEAAARAALDVAGLSPTDLDLIICCTGTPGVISPSLACRVLHALGEATGTKPEVPAYDLAAACSGYLFGLANAFDFTQARPDSRVLLLTAEALSPLADPGDFDTAILFGDAATATVVLGPDAPPGGVPTLGRLRRPVLSSRGEPGEILRVPAGGDGFLAMDGLRVYAEAVRRMISLLGSACEADGVSPGELDLIVPHQANARIINDIRMRLGLDPGRAFVHLRDVGNTSSSSIPLALADLASRGALPRSIGLTAFGAGFTFGAALLRGEERPARPARG
ncbi:thiamine pyrophosphate-dependent enzyme [Tautonia plasticadhaerens]|uniref:3-methyl-2-oxobutanoate dehydrogenase (2-methylpropanoyl-transferring) n=1 Tax=Tautonia plasticadhaerens TaxID=2527974 RepID=A0A518H759_9BACT|nr:thiamine pyrophosphate-dependent enzyme [Tautonia plasticadhaerens]QDV36698.1 2-oxoisovalerate dehydrogenase subunit beta [Tautonia plasticadhaerens]